MTDKHLLFWVFKLMDYCDEYNIYRIFNTIDKDDFELVGAPDWVYPAFNEKRKQYTQKKESEILASVEAWFAQEEKGGV